MVHVGVGNKHVGQLQKLPGAQHGDIPEIKQQGFALTFQLYIKRWITKWLAEQLRMKKLHDVLFPFAGVNNFPQLCLNIINLSTQVLKCCKLFALCKDSVEPGAINLDAGKRAHVLRQGTALRC